MGNVFLTGFMGTGKSAVGRALAERLERPFVDLDATVEETEGLRVAEIFARFGEAGFRTRERGALERASALAGAVVATGGGVVLDARNRSTMRARGRIVCLTADAETILGRVGRAADRPLLAGAPDPVERIVRLLGERAAAYEEADCTIDTSHLSVPEVVEAIVRQLSATEKAPRRGRASSGLGAG